MPIRLTQAPDSPPAPRRLMNNASARVMLFLVAIVLAAAVLGTRSRDASPVASSVSPNPKAVEPPVGIPRRATWTSSRVTGSPEPPPPYRTERVWPKLKFQNPVLVKPIPHRSGEPLRYLVAEQRGSILSFVDMPDADAIQPVLDVFRESRTLPEEGPHRRQGNLYGVAFHPKFLENRYVYLCYVMDSNEPARPQQPDGSRVSRFVMPDADPPRIDPASEEVLLTWLGGGHNGGCLEFGPDGCLYISTGDGSFPNPPDALLYGQDVTNLNSAILRIDVDRREGERLYRIPDDNPLVDIPDARGEIWAYGFRNPWRMTFDRATGDLWVGDVGWELYEMVDRIEKGGNYGWSVMEGRQSVRPEAKRGPTPILPPTIDLPHSMAASVTGGYVYRGTKFPELVGRYVFGDWETRRMWAATWDASQKAVTEMVEIVEPSLRIVCYAETPEGELLVVDYDDGTIHEFQRSEVAADQPAFPTKLSETGLFASVADHAPTEGVVPFSINAEMWADGAVAERFLALPGDSSVTWHKGQVPIPGTIFNRVLEFPKDAVLMKTISVSVPAESVLSALRRVETQLLHFNGRVWRGYSYRWNDDQTDATLVDAEGEETTIDVADPSAPDGRRRQTYEFTARAACVRCHNPWAQHALAFAIPQVNRERNYESGVRDHQLRALEHAGLLKRAASSDGSGSTYDDVPHLVDPHDDSQPLEARARSYLQANCAHCHQFGGGGTADIELRFETPIEKTKSLGLRPMQGTFGIPDAAILSPGDPYRSVLYYRMAKLGKGRMPHIGSHVLDEHGLRLIHDWIRQLPVRTDERGLIAQLRTLDEPAVVAREAKERDRRRARLAEQIARDRIHKERTAAGDAGRPLADKVEPTEADVAAAVARDEEESARRAADRARQRQTAIAKLLASSSSSLVLARTLHEESVPSSIREEILATARAHGDVQVQDLFEQFLPPEQRAKRLGSVVRVNELLALRGDAERGRRLFFETPTVQCKSCHRIGEEGSRLGPELTEIGKQRTRAQILESLLEPSKLVDPKYVVYMAETRDGRVVTGLLVERNDREVVLRNAKDEAVRISGGDLETLVPQRQSLMPDLLLRDMTQEQAADLLEFLASLKGI